MIGKHQLTQEQSQDVSTDDVEQNEFTDLNNLFLPPAEYPVVISHFSESKALAYIHFSDQIPFNHSTDVVSPPPDSII